MSDESPPPLRLKPRVRSDSGGDSAPANATPPPPAPLEPPEKPTASVPSETTRLRLKPKLAVPVDQPGSPSEDTPAASVPPSAPPIRLKPALPRTTAPGDSPAVAGSNSVNLPPPPPPPPPDFPKPPARIEAVTNPAPGPMADPSDGETAPAGLAASTEWLSSKGKPPQPNAFPVMAEPSTDEDESAEAEPAVPHLRASAVGRSKPPEGSGATRSRRGGKPLVSALAVLVISAGGFLTFRILTKRPPPPAPPPAKAPAVVKSPATPKAGPTPSATLNELAAAPAKAIAKAQAVVTASRTIEQDRIDLETKADPVSAKAPPGKPAPIAVAPREPQIPPAPVTSTSQLAPGVSASTAAHVAGEASPAFRSWVANARISGLFQGNPPRALINGRLVSGGQVVDDLLQITFDHIDSHTKMIVFRDPTGATVARKF